MSGPLADIKVLDLAWVVAGPMIGRSLADFGATVVRVEHPKRVDTARAIGPYYGGGYDVQRSACYANGNAGKLGLALDLQNEDARDVVRELAAWADVVVESFAPGQVNRWGLDYDSLKAINPKIIMVSTSLMGQAGPWKALAGFGNIGAAMSGYQGLVGPEEGLPTGPFGPYTDYVAPRFGIPMVLAALDWRARSGEGCYIDLGQAETGMQFLASAFADYGATGRIAKAEGNRDAAMAPHGVYPALTKEGEDPPRSQAVRPPRRSSTRSWALGPRRAIRWRRPRRCRVWASRPRRSPTPPTSPRIRNWSTWATGSACPIPRSARRRSRPAASPSRPRRPMWPAPRPSTAATRRRC